MRRVIAVALTIAALIVAAGAPVRADTGGSAWTDDGGIQQGVTNESGTDGSSGSAVTVPCTYDPLPPAYVPMYSGDGDTVPLDTPGQWLLKTCGTDYFGAVFIPAQDPQLLAEQARKYLPLPAPAPRMSPAGDQIVNLPSWLWVDGPWEPKTSTVAVPGVSVTVTAVPVSVVWSMGDGTEVTCAGPGTPYEPSRPDADQLTSCSHTYTRSSAEQPGDHYTVTVSVRWSASWAVVGAPGGGDLGTITRATSFPVRVGEVQALNTATQGDRPW
jgi:hypothetical protein